ALHTAVGAAAAWRTPRPDDDVADVPGVAGEPVDQPAIQNQAAADAGGDDHAQHVVGAVAGPAPALADGERLGVVVDDARQRETFDQAVGEREVAPGGDVDWADDAFGVAHGSAAPDADAPHASSGGRQDAAAGRLEGDV